MLIVQRRRGIRSMEKQRTARKGEERAQQRHMHGGEQQRHDTGAGTDSLLRVITATCRDPELEAGRQETRLFEDKRPCGMASREMERRRMPAPDDHELDYRR